MPLAKAQADASQVFPNAVRDESGWMNSSWFGWWWDAYDPWLFHAEHGWLFHGSGNEADGLMLYDTHLRAWVSTRMSDYSWFYAFAPINDWIYYSRPGVAGGRWYFRASAGVWAHEQDLLRPKSMAFDNANSDVAAIILPPREGAPTLVILRHPESGTARHLVFISDDGDIFEIIADAAGRIGQITIGEHLFVFSDYTATTARLVYHAPDGSTSEQIINIEASSASAMAARSGALGTYVAAMDEEDSIDSLVQDAAEWLADPSNTHLPLNIWRVAGETVHNAFVSMTETAGIALEEARNIARTVRNEITCLTETGRTCAEVLAEDAPALLDGLTRLDPNAETTAGIDVKPDGAEPRREDWDPLIIDGKIDPAFSMSDVPCGESVFAEMNPDCPQYVPPREEPTDPTDPTDPNEPPQGVLQAHDMILYTAINTPLTQELAASGATGYEIVTYPGSGTLVLESAATGAFTYQPADGFEGTVSFLFVAVNGEKRSNEGFVTITISSCKDHWTEVLEGDWKISGMPAGYPIQDYSIKFTIKANGFGQSTLYWKETYTRDGNPTSSIERPPTITYSTWGGESGCWLGAKFLLLGSSGGTIRARLHSDFYEPEFVDVTFTRQ